MAAMASQRALQIANVCLSYLSFDVFMETPGGIVREPFPKCAVVVVP